MRALALTRARTRSPGVYSDAWHNAVPVQDGRQLVRREGVGRERERGRERHAQQDLKEHERVRELEWERDRERNRARTRSPYSMGKG